MRPRVLCVLFLVFGLCLSAIPSLAQIAPQYKLGFKDLADQIPTVVGVPLENEHWGANGDSLQRTAKGLMVWRKADNWTAFTNGAMTWINGPDGVQSRPNTERFAWEGDTVPDAPALVAAPTPAPVAQAAAPTQAAAPSAASPGATANSACLACHGPFDKIASASADYVWANGERANPHVYVPHSSRNAADIPACSDCHKPHPVPLTASDKASMPKADPSWCYSCHHTGDLKCGTCHS